MWVREFLFLSGLVYLVYVSSTMKRNFFLRLEKIREFFYDFVENIFSVFDLNFFFYIHYSYVLSLWCTGFPCFFLRFNIFGWEYISSTSPWRLDSFPALDAICCWGRAFCVTFWVQVLFHLGYYSEILSFVKLFLFWITFIIQIFVLCSLHLGICSYLFWVL